MVTELLKCPRCGAETSKGELAGLCPKCTFGQIVDALDVASGELPVGTELGDYTIVARVAKGGMGVVYRARQKSLGRDVALKVLAIADHPAAEALARFSREAALTGRLDHPGIVPVHEFGQKEGIVYLTMPFVQGETLTEVLRKKRPSVRESLELVRRLTQAVGYAHERRILHRDLKPANVLVDAQGEPRITDFGLAREMAGDNRLTLAGIAMGTPPYAAPELVGGRLDQVDRRTDIYALGAILYELLTGRVPFDGATPEETIQRVLTAEPEPPRRLVATIPADAEAICLKCLDKDRDRRYATASELAADLERAIKNEPVHARPVTTITRLSRRVARNKAQTVAYLSTSALIVVLGILVLRGSTADPPRRNSASVAERAREVAREMRALFSQSPVDHAKVRELQSSRLSALQADLLRDPATVEAWFHLGACHALLGDRTLAIDFLTEAIRLEPRFRAAREARLKLWVREYQRAKSFDDGRAIWALIQGDLPNAPDVKAYAEATRDWRTGKRVEWRPDLTDAGECMLAGLAGDAAKFSRVIELEPENGEAHFNRAKARWDVDRPGSEEDLRRAVKFTPSLGPEAEQWRRDHP